MNTEITTDYYSSAEQIASIPLTIIRACEHDANDNPWRILDESRHTALAQRTWPDYVFADVKTFLDAGRRAYGNTDMRRLIRNTQLLSIFGSWRITRGVYCFDTELSHALTDTDPADAIPINILLRLPEWSVCIFGAGLGRTSEIVCAFASINYRDPENPPEFIISAVHTDTTRSTLSIELKPDATVASGIAAMLAEQKTYADPTQFAKLAPDEDRFAALFSNILAHVLYLCADEPDMHPPPERPQPQKTKHGPRFFPPAAGSRIVPVGARFGAIFRTTRAAFAQAQAHATTGRTMPPHWRRAHWTHFWIGPRKNEHRDQILHWLAPTFVNATTDELPVVIRNVT